VGRRPERRRAAAAAAAVLVLLLAPGAGGAGPGHAHDGGEAGGDAGGTAAMDAPSRLPDGTVFLPKVSQRLLEVRTATLREGEASRAVSLVGRVVADPNRGGLAQSIAGGRVVPPEGGLLRLGQTVRRGEVLAVVEQIRAAPEIVRAPADGVIASARVVAGQVVAAQDVLFQVVDPAGLWVEALVFGADAARDFREATASVRGGQPMRLTLQGFGRAVQQGATLAQFRIEDPPPDLALGQPVTVVARLAEPVRGLILPRAAVVRAASGERVVWRHVEPETFSAAPVRVEPLDAARVLVAAGLRAGERVVVQGAGLVNQVR
jgi:biotin carboxyl carrier protein